MILPLGATKLVLKLWMKVGLVRSSILSQGNSTQLVTFVQSVDASGV